MVWKSKSQKEKIKKRIRRRDGYRCAACGMDSGMHNKRFGKDLDVHRIEPGSVYSLKWGVCITLCDVCHDAMHGKGVWRWIARNDPDDEEELARWVKRSSRRDVENERAWRRQEAWGTWLRRVRETVAEFSQVKLASLARVSKATIEDWEAGRREPVLSEARELAKALEISLDDLAQEFDPGESWLEAAQKRSDARALAFRAREAREGEVLGTGAKVVWDAVEQADKKREQARMAAEERAAERLREMSAKGPLDIGEPTDEVEE